ncbi:methyltransferase domain-containing protein [Streptomyces atroolivaceus]|uniref:methyltransferase domain-containing protein n=1 Tax=Streptomyces atroolivaceus TaxID=66869 RepID=UPI0037A544D7
MPRQPDPPPLPEPRAARADQRLTAFTAPLAQPSGEPNLNVGELVTAVHRIIPPAARSTAARVPGSTRSPTHHHPEEKTVETDMPDYAASWETYWTAAETAWEPSLWDTEPELASAVDLPRFAQFLGPGRCLLNLGCGNGSQTRHLARHIERVMGADASAAAVRAASAQDPHTEYLVLDMFDSPAVRALHDRMGDVDLYMRTVLHQILPEHRPAFAESLRTLLGATGVLALVELSPGAEEHLDNLVARYGAPPSLSRVLSAGIRPGGVDQHEALALLRPDRFTVLAKSDAKVHLTYRLPDGNRVGLPAYFTVLGPRRLGEVIDLAPSPSRCGRR